MVYAEVLDESTRRLTKNRFMAIGSVITGAIQSVGVENQQTCRAPALRQLQTAHYLNAETPLKSDEPVSLVRRAFSRTVVNRSRGLVNYRG